MTRRLTWLFLVPALILLIQAGALCSQDEGKALKSNALVILKAKDLAETRALIADIEADGARVLHVFPPRVLICDVPADVEFKVRGKSGVAALHRTELAVGDADEDVIGIKAWNSLINPPPAPLTKGEPLIADVKRHALDGETFEPSASIAASSPPSSSQTSEFMIGSVAVGLVIPESAGSGENWTTARQDTVVSEVTTGCEWWATYGGTKAHLTFYYDVHRDAATQYEPIQMSSNQDSQWISESLTAIGYPGSSDFTQSRDYINAIRSQFGTDWGFCIFVVDSLNDSDGKFTDGYFGYAYLGGPYVVMTWDNDGWGIGNMDIVTSHEMGHIFLAGDEYCSPGYACCDMGYYGYLYGYNGNCENGNPASVSCMMKNNVHTLCTYTPTQIGWRDTDGDSLYDPIDTAVSVTASTSSPGPTYSFSGTATDVACDSPSRVECTINHIASVEYSVDGGAWQPATPNDAFDSSQELFSFTAGPFYETGHSITVRATNNVGNVGTTVWNQPTPDTTPPVPPSSVTDGGATTTVTNTLKASWTAGSDPESGIAEYAYAIGTSPTDPGSGYIAGWTSTGLTRTVNRKGLSLQVGQTYYFYVKCRNGVGLWSATSRASDGILVIKKGRK